VKTGWRAVLMMSAAWIAFCVTHAAQAQEPPYFVTYSHAMEEPGNLEVEFKGSQASPSGAHAFGGGIVEYEYGAKAWWTTELYLDGQKTAHDSAVFTGFRWENRFRPLMEEHRVNPVLYVEYEDVNAADRSLLEVVGNDGVEDVKDSNAEGRSEVEREMELKLILSSNARGWNFSENFISEKNMMGSEPWEFGYALGASRPLTLRAGARECMLCRERFAAGAELYGGLGTTDSVGLRDTSHYLAPVVAYETPRGPRITFSPGFGLNNNSIGVLYRVGVSYEFQQFFSRFHHEQVR